MMVFGGKTDSELVQYEGIMAGPNLCQVLELISKGT